MIDSIYIYISILFIYIDPIL